MVGTEAGDARPAIRLAMAHAVQSPSPHTPNNWGKTGMATVDRVQVPDTSRPRQAWPVARGPTPRSRLVAVRDRQRARQISAHVVPRHLSGRTGQPDQIPPCGHPWLKGSKSDTKPTTDPIALHRCSRPTRKRIRHVDPHGVGAHQRKHPQAPVAPATSLPAQQGELSAPADRPDQAESRCRPFARRDLRTARPARVDIL